MLCADEMMLLTSLILAGVMLWALERRAVNMLLTTLVNILAVQTEDTNLGDSSNSPPLTIGHGSEQGTTEGLVSIMILIDIFTVTLILKNAADSAVLISLRSFEQLD